MDGVRSECLRPSAIELYLISLCYTSLYRCRAFPHELEKEGAPRFREHTEALLETFTARELWDVFGVIESVKVSLPYRFSHM